MCGIVAIFGDVPASHLAINECATLLNSIKHRGPDYQKYTVEDGKFALGHARLAINDMSEYSNQPFQKDGLIVLFNGEIYNAKANGFDRELDFIVEAYKTGRDFRHLLEGQYAIVIVDTTKPTYPITLVRDKWGICPLYYGYDSKRRLIISSERRVQVLAQTIQTMEVFPNERLFGQFNPISGNFKVGYKFEECREQQLNSGILNCSIAKQLLKESVLSRCSHTDAGYEVALSGGLDSCLLTKIMVDLGLQPRCYTVSFEGADDANYARRFAEDFNLEHTLIKVTKDQIIADLPKMLDHLEDPVPNEVKFRGYVRNWFVAKHSEAKVIICGEGADELFGGYPQFKDCSPLEMGVKRQLAIKSMRAINLDRVDRGGMAWSKEYRMPFLEYNFARYVLGSVVLPQKESLKAIARMSGVPEYIIKRPKYGSDEALFKEVFEEAKKLWK